MSMAYAVGIVLTAAIAFLSGLRGFTLVLVTVVGSVLAFLVVAFIIGLLRPARVELRPPTDLRVRFPEGPCEEGRNVEGTN